MQKNAQQQSLNAQENTRAEKEPDQVGMFLHHHLGQGDVALGRLVLFLEAIVVILPMGLDDLDADVVLRTTRTTLLSVLQGQASLEQLKEAGIRLRAPRTS